MAYQDNEGFQSGLLSACHQDALILTSGGRLARHLKHQYRESQMATGKTGWVSPEILSLNAWIWKAWNMTWPPTRPLSQMNCLLLWKEASNRVPPPEPFLSDFKLFQDLDETYTALVRHGLPPDGAYPSATPLLAWRRQIMQAFESLTRDLHGFHPALLPVRLAEAIREGRVPFPKTMVLAAFEAPAPIEEVLFDTMAGLCELTRLELPTGIPNKTARIVMPNRRQEVAWLARQLVVDAQTVPLNRIGVIVPDTEAYVPQFRRAFHEIMGESFDQTRSGYNISMGTSLLERSLVQSGLLPLRFWMEGQSRVLLLSLLLSTYYSRWSRERDRIARIDRVWRTHGIDAGLHALLDVLSDHSPELFALLNEGHPSIERALRVLAEEAIRTGTEWVEVLEAFWDAAGFPVIGDEADTGAWNHLKTLLHHLREDLGDVLMSLSDYMGVLSHFLAKEMVHVGGSEEAGIQVLGIIESRGLHFEKLYVVGLTAGSLPRPVRPFPLLDAEERRRVLGATAESEYAFAQKAFRHLLACAPDVTLTRPEEESAEPLAPSPFWVQVAGEEAYATTDVWNSPDGVWARAAWLQQANRGLAQPVAFPPTDPPVDDHVVPETVSVSELSIAFLCLFRFFAETMLKVVPLDEPIVGISPLDRGSSMHRVLALFTKRCRDQDLIGDNDMATMEDLLEACSEQVLLPDERDSGHAHMSSLLQYARTVERIRWLGDKSGAPGLLKVWLRLERQRLEEGWRWLSEETPFDGLSDPGWPFSVAGRIDRIDHHDRRGFSLWDYKSGGLPTQKDILDHLIDPQIPAYVQAAKEGRLPEIPKQGESNVNISGGYIALTTPSTVAHKALVPKGGGWSQTLRRWKEAVSRIGEKLVSGQFGAEPGHVSSGVREEKVCRYCSYRPVCGRMGRPGPRHREDASFI